MQALLVCRARSFGVPPSELSLNLKVKVLDMGSKPLSSQGETGSWEFPPDSIVSLQGWGL